MEIELPTAEERIETAKVWLALNPDFDNFWCSLLDVVQMLDLQAVGYTPEIVGQHSATHVTSWAWRRPTRRKASSMAHSKGMRFASTNQAWRAWYREQCGTLLKRAFKLEELLKAARDDETLSPIRQRQLIGPSATPPARTPHGCP